MGIFSAYSCLNPEAGNLQTQTCCLTTSCTHIQTTQGGEDAPRGVGWSSVRSRPPPAWEGDLLAVESKPAYFYQDSRTQGPRSASGTREERLTSPETVKGPHVLILSFPGKRPQSVCLALGKMGQSCSCKGQGAPRSLSAYQQGHLTPSGISLGISSGLRGHLTLQELRKWPSQGHLQKWYRGLAQSLKCKSALPHPAGSPEVPLVLTLISPQILFEL